MEKEKEIKDSQYLRMKDKFERCESVREYYEQIGYPEAALKNIEENLKNADKYTIRVIQEYLRFDNHELIKNLAQTMNVGNHAMVIAYKDGAIGRNEALIKKLESLKAGAFHDKIEGTVRQMHKTPKEES